MKKKKNGQKKSVGVGYNVNNKEEKNANNGISQGEIKISDNSAEIESPYSGIHEKAQGVPEQLAEELCDALEEAREKEEIRHETGKRHPGMVGFREILLALGFGILLYWVLNHANGIFNFLGSVADVLSPLIIGCCIAFILNLVLISVEELWKIIFGGLKNDKVKKYISKLKRPFCLVISTLILFGLICGIILIVIPELGVTFKMFADMAPGVIKKVEIWLGGITEFLSERGIAVPDFIPDADKAIKMVTDLFTQRGQQMLDATVGVTTSLFSVLFDVVLSFVFAFYVLAQKEQLAGKIKNILYALTGGSKADNIIKIAALSNSSFTKFVTGQFAEALIIGVLCFVGMSLFRMPYSGVISVVIGATALVPIFGAFIGAAIGALLILALDFMQAVWFIVFIVVLQQIETNFIYPKVVGKSIGLPGILVLASVTVGGAVFGFAGIILGVPVCSVIYCIFNEFVEKRAFDKKHTQINEKDKNGER